MEKALDDVVPLAWAGYVASAWMIVFAVLSFYWALGGTAGINTVSLGQELTGELSFITILWLTGILKLGGGVLALALVQPWGQLLPRRLVLLSAWGVSVLLVLHGSDFMIQGALTEDRLIGLPAPATWTTAHWQTFVWGPWWLLGGIAFYVATWNYQRRSR
ncbi:DUF3995 domain-containing protein [Haladaptatus salinisoli]|uniref:DUF3995 domain-containing protein n=1 Tax=Haladaptatus salinisoli TaxID=2884876 RepID=UPI001D09CB30|nr:DUF3995 domain-containing protein [Haladaptatus salinisoli]